MRNSILIFSVILFFAVDLQATGTFLVRNGSTDFIIVLPNLPQQIEQVAANELKTYLDGITQTTWNIARENDVAEDVPQILVGNLARAKKFFPEIVQENIPYDGIELHLKGNKLLLTGHEQRGTLYAVNTFLEDVLGIRWWTSTEQYVPTFTTFELKPINISYAPKLIYREVLYKDVYENPVFAARMKNNGHFPQISPIHGDHHRFMYFCHSFYHLIPPEKYFATHPEWFSEIDGKRTAESTHNYSGQAQLCLTNDEMRKELSKNAIDALRKNPRATFISISQNDGWTGYCTCENCNRVAEEEGSQSGPLIRFVNRVAEDIEEEFPNMIVETLAYTYSAQPPKHVAPRHNVVVRLCSYECSFIKPLTDPQNKPFRDVMQSWGKLTNHLFIWDYVANFSSYILPYPNLRVLGPNIRFFVENQTIGLFQDADSRCSVGDFVRMRNWIILHLMWDPSLDQNELMREFLEGYYGKQATPFLMEYFDTLIDKAESTLTHMGIYYQDTNGWLDYETLCRATALFDQAITAAIQESGNDSEYVQRLRRERLPIEHVWLKEYYHFKEYAEANGKDFCGPNNPVEACKNFRAICDKYQVNSHCETCSSGMFEVYKENLCRQFGNTPTPTSAQIKDNIGQTIKAYPNPAFEYVTIGGLEGNGILTVFDTVGRLLLQRDVASSEATIDVKTLPDGIYFVRIDEESELKTIKIIVEK